MHLKLRGKLLVIFILLLVITVMALMDVVNYSVRNMIIFNIQEKLNSDMSLGYSYLEKSYPGEWSIKDGKLLKGDKVINEDYTLVDEIKKQTGSFVTIFQGDTRVSTNVLKEDGSRAVNTKAAENVINTVLKNGTPYSGEAKVVNMKCLTKYIPIKDGSGKVIGMWFTGVAKEKADKEIRTLTIILGSVSLAAIVVGILILIFFTGQIVRSVNNILTSIKAVAAGDLTLRTSVKRRDEIGLIADNLNLMIDEFNRLIREVKELSSTVAESSEESKASSEEVRKVTEQVALAVTELAKGASDQARSTEKSNVRISQVVEGLRKIAEDMNKAKHLTEQSEAAVKEGEESVRLQEIKVKENVAVVSEVSESVADLNNKSSEIGQILEVIKGIAEQTNLLALNAAIEAARAGEQGKGFAVVAEEIRKLAEQSSHSVKQITEIIRQVQESVGASAAKMDKTKSVAEEQAEALSETIKIFGHLASAVHEITRNIKFVSEASGELTQEAASAADEIQNIASIAQESAAGTEEVAASTEEQTSITHHIADASDRLAEMANKLALGVKRFKV
ncbi:MAG: methyl-accepting chemotaxis protein [Clostridia bacterium]|nr:methyl-accepting chemotaxis protein [Clostridia bacterium]